MTEIAALASRRFTMGDQRGFAALSGDYNPMHMDPDAARRMPSGACVVHGVQAMLWALEYAAAKLPFGALCALDADFAQFLYVDELAVLSLSRRNAAEAKFELRAGETRIAQYVLRFGERPVLPPAPPAATPMTIDYPAASAAPMALCWDEMCQAAGRVAFYRPAAEVERAYPQLSAAIGVHRVNALLSLTRLVGMAVPGLHSTFHRLSAKLLESSHEDGHGLSFTAGGADPRFGIVNLAVFASGLNGTLKTSQRAKPVNQPSSLVLREAVSTQGYTAHRALVIGGSRGLGEITAKILGLMGVELIIGYTKGRGEAEAVAEDIRNAGGRAQVIAYDILDPTPWNPDFGRLDSMYYFATPRISSRAAASYSAELYHRFAAFYVDGFHASCLKLSAGHPSRLQVFYPSSVFVSEPERNMAEYAMAKAAGEILAAQLTRFSPRLEIEAVRLPRMPTDQTAGMIEQQMASAAEVMIPIITRVERRVAESLS
jgi:hypothetical protein